MQLNERIQSVMKERNMRQVDICKTTGIYSSQVAHIVTGRTKDPAISYLIKFATALDVSLDYLVGRDMTKIRYTDEYKQCINDAIDNMDEIGKRNLADQAEYQLERHQKV